jgi:crotonobetainyl-CoA:carnitine CoA-transferase CaiB-like acyl-CoA transferase
MTLGDMGAEVIKVENPDRGDDTRQWGVKVGEANTSYYNCANRNKQSICLNLNTERGQRIARDLARQCDVVVQNFKTGGAEKLGLGYEDLRTVNPGIIYCSISGYDRDGSEARRPGYDLVVQGEAGLMSLSGAPGSGPLRLGIAAVDLFTGMYAAQAILAALFERERTGRGRHVQLSLYDSGLTITSYLGLEALAKGATPPKFGNGHPLIVPYGVFEAADGPLVITVGNNSQFERFCTEVIDRPDLVADERFKTNPLRSANRGVLLPEVVAELVRRPRQEILLALKAADIPCGEVLGVLEALQSTRTREAGMLAGHSNSLGGDSVVLAPPYKFDGARLPVRRMPPSLGQDTQTVLQSLLDLGPEDMALLAEEGVI